MAAANNTVPVTHKSGDMKLGGVNSTVNQRNMPKQKGVRASGISLSPLGERSRLKPVHDFMNNLKHRRTRQKTKKLAS
jgi:hypothetical protein